MSGPHPLTRTSIISWACSRLRRPKRSSSERASLWTSLLPFTSLAFELIVDPAIIRIEATPAAKYIIAKYKGVWPFDSSISSDVPASISHFAVFSRRSLATICSAERLLRSYGLTLALWSKRTETTSKALHSFSNPHASKSGVLERHCRLSPTLVSIIPESAFARSRSAAVFQAH